MDAIFDWFRGHIHGEFSTVTGAPVLFLMAALACAVLAFLASKAFHSERIRAHEATIAHKQSQLDEYKDRLQGQTPVEVAKEIATLKDRVAELVAQINRPQRRLTDDQMAIFAEGVANGRQNGLFDPTWIASISTTPDTESSRFGVQIWKMFEQNDFQIMFNAMGIHGEGEHGIIFYCPDGQERDANYQAISDLFEKMGLELIWTCDPGDPMGSEYMFVAPEAG